MPCVVSFSLPFYDYSVNLFNPLLSIHTVPVTNPFRFLPIENSAISNVHSIDESKLESRQGDRKKANVSSYVLPSSSISCAPIEALRKTIFATNAVILSRHQSRCQSIASASPERRQISPLHRHCRPHKVVGTPQMRRQSRKWCGARTPP